MASFHSRCILYNGTSQSRKPFLNPFLSSRRSNNPKSKKKYITHIRFDSSICFKRQLTLRTVSLHWPPCSSVQPGVFQLRPFVGWKSEAGFLPFFNDNCRGFWQRLIATPCSLCALHRWWGSPERGRCHIFSMSISVIQCPASCHTHE